MHTNCDIDSHTRFIFQLQVAFSHTMHYKHKVTVYSSETGKSTECSSIQYQATTVLDKEVKVIIVLWIWRKSWQESQHRGYLALIHMIHTHTVNRFFTCCCLNWRGEENNTSLSEFRITCHTKKQTQLRIFLRTCKKDFCHWHFQHVWIWPRAKNDNYTNQQFFVIWDLRLIL